MTTTETYEQAVERIMRAVRCGTLSLEEAAAEWRAIRTLQHERDAARVEYEWRKRHVRKQGQGEHE